MRIEINLLQNEEKKKRQPLILIIILILLSLLALLIWIIQAEKVELNSLHEELQTIEQQIQAHEKKLDLVDSLHSVNVLELAISAVENDKVNIIPILQHVTNILPEKGYILSLNYNPDSLTIDIQFNQRIDAAYYLTAINRTEWISTANLHSVFEYNQANESSEQAYVAHYTISLKTNTGTEMIEEGGS